MADIKDLSGNGIIENMGAYSGDDYGPAEDTFNITPNDDEDLPRTTRLIVVGTGGDLAYWDRRNEAHVVTLPAGQFNIAAVRVLATGTDATDLVGFA